MIYLILLFVLLFVYHQYTTFKHRHVNTIWKTWSKTINHRPVFYGNFYNIHRGPRELKYILMHPEVMRVFEDIRFVTKYSPNLFFDILIFVEYFMKFHYNIMIEKYEPALYIPIMNDMRLIIYDMMNEFVYVLPDVSTVVDIPNIDKHMRYRTKKLDAVLIHYLDMLRHKYYSQCAHLFQ